MGRPCLLPCRHRRIHKARPRKLNLQRLAPGHGIVEVLTGNQIHGAAFPGEDLHRTQALARLHQALRLKLAEAVVQQTGMVVPIVGGVDGHRNELPAVPGGAGDQNPACRPWYSRS